MPLYDCKCQQCGKVEEIYRSIAERNLTPVCCGQQMTRVITAAYVVPDVDMITDNITGDPVHITSRKQLKKVCDDNDVRPTEGFLWR